MHCEPKSNSKHKVLSLSSQASPRHGQRHGHGDIAVAVLALALQVIVLVFGYITWGQFGWRTYSKVAADMRVTNVEQQRWSFVLVNCFTTLVKLDIQVRCLSQYYRHTDWHHRPGRHAQMIANMCCLPLTRTNCCRSF